MTGRADTAQDFSDWFIEQSGISRQAKIYEKFKGTTAETILATYNEAVEEALEETRLDAHALAFARRIKRAGLPTAIVSGGDFSEIQNVLAKSGANGIFDSVLCPPVSKKKHLQSLNAEHNGKRTLYFGDSPVDAQACLESQTDFCFVKGFACVPITSIAQYAFTIESFTDITP